MFEHENFFISVCNDCGSFFTLNPYACRNCGSTVLKQQAASGKGVIRAVTHIFRAPDSTWQEKTPYSLALIKLIESPSMMAHVPLDAKVGDQVNLKEILNNDKK